LDNKWLPLAITQEDLSGGFTIVLTTDIACHLYLFWTDKVPWVHRASKLDRGLTIPWDAYWCFVAWTLIDQNEPGDTLTHTYTWLGWQVCQTKYFRFHGTIGGASSPSDSPIFHKHYSYIAPTPGMKENFYWRPPTAMEAIYHARWRGYSYQAESSYHLSSVKVYLTRANNPISLECYIYHAGDNWHPVGDPIATGQFLDGSVPPHPDFAQVEVELTGCDIVEGQKYAVIFLQEVTVWPNYFMLGTDFPCPQYKLLISNNAGVNWSLGAETYSPCFENWGA